MSYNGYPNYETWVAKLWIDNDEGSQSYWFERATELGLYDLADALKDEIKEQAQELLPDASLYTDLLISAIDEIDFQHIAESLKTDLLEITEYEESNY